ncbi:MAG: class I SAM-dependent methyltransferase [Burkholderiales bacterium]|nr:class I SAM-dependent methyltransferase [Burkholderiales bacterium]
MRTLTSADNCDLCGGRIFIPELQVGTWQLMRCSSCGLVFTSPRYTESSIAQLYSAEYYQGTPAYYLSQMSPPSTDDLNLARSAARTLRRRGRSLDVGCGTGRLVEAFRLAGFQASGIEPNEMAATAGRQLGREITSISLSEVPSESMDCITAMHVLEHAYSPRAFLAQCHRVLHVHGILIIEVPNYASRAARRLRERWEPLYPDTHLYQFTPETLKLYLINSGLKLLSVREVGGGGFLHSTAASSLSASEGSAPTAVSLAGRMRAWLWLSRHMVYGIPYAKEAVRFLYWHVLGQGEFVRIQARKESSTDLGGAGC